MCARGGVRSWSFEIDLKSQRLHGEEIVWWNFEGRDICAASCHKLIMQFDKFPGMNFVLLS